jgi:hypothetical protein
MTGLLFCKEKIAAWANGSRTKSCNVFWMASLGSGLGMMSYIRARSKGKKQVWWVLQFYSAKSKIIVSGIVKPGDFGCS